jgi:hypothetical protein
LECRTCAPPRSGAARFRLGSGLDPFILGGRATVRGSRGAAFLFEHEPPATSGASATSLAVPAAASNWLTRTFNASISAACRSSLSMSART